MQNNSFSDSRVGGGSVKSEKIVLMMSHMMSQQGVLGNFEHGNGKPALQRGGVV